MRRTKRGRFWHAGLLFLVYSCIYVYSDKAADTEPPGPQSTSTVTPTFKKDMLELSTQQSATNGSTLATTEPTMPQAPHVHPTWRPKRTNCSPPAIEQFPRPIMGPGIRKHGGE